MRFSIVIATYNRAALLKDTLGVVEAASASYPAPLRYAFEKEQGRSAALNHGFRVARGEIIVTTDDDVRVGTDWLTTIERGLETLKCDYVGGRVLPIWESPPPHWIPRTNGRLWAVIAL